MAKNDTETKPKRKEKPENEKHKTVYFNTKNANDAALFKYAQSVGVRNFSGFVKSLIYQEMVRRDNKPPNPYEYATLPMTHPGSFIQEPVLEDEEPSVAVKVQKATRKTRVSKIKGTDEDVKIVVGGKKIEPTEEEPEELVIEDVVEEEIIEEIDDIDVPVEEEEEPEEEAPSSRSALAQGMLNQFKRG